MQTSQKQNKLFTISHKLKQSISKGLLPTSMLFPVAYAITWCPTIVKQQQDKLDLVPYLNATFNVEKQALDLNLSIPYLSDNSKYAYVVDFGNRTFKFSNYENKIELNSALKSISSTPTAEYACSSKSTNAFTGGKNWNVSVENCNYISYTTSVPLDSTVFNRIQEAGNIMAYTAKLYLFRVSPDSSSRTKVGTSLNDEYIFEIRIQQRISTAYDSKDLNKLHYFVPNVNVQDEPSVFQSKIDRNVIKTYLSIDRLQIMKASSNLKENVQYDNLDQKASCSAEGKERVLNTTLRSTGNNTRVIEIIYANLDCINNKTSSQDIFNVYITETITVTVDQVAEYHPVSIKPVNQTVHRIQAPENASTVTAVYCDGKKLSGGVFNRSSCKNLNFNYTINDVVHTYETQIGEIAGNPPALYTYDPYETLTNMSWNDGLLCLNTQENAFISSKETYCQMNPLVCEQIDAPVEEEETEEEETPVIPPSDNNGTNGTDKPNNSTNNSTNNNTNNTNNSTGGNNNTNNNNSNSSINSTAPEDEECIGDDCAKDGVGRTKAAVIGAAAAAAAAIGILL